MTISEKNMMNNGRAPLSLPAEWEPQAAVIMAWPHKLTDWAPTLDDARRCFGDIVRAVSAETPVILIAPSGECAESVAAMRFGPDRVRIVDIPTNDTWARDFGPLTLVDASGRPVCLDFKFNGWGLKFAADLDNLINSRLSALGLLPGSYENRLNFVLEGGSIDSDGQGTLLTTSECLLSKNRNGEWTRVEIEAYLRRTLGAERVLWLDRGALAGDDTDSHIDTLARFADPETIVYCGCGEEGDPNNVSLEAMHRQLMELRRPDGQPYNLVELPLPAPIYDPEGMQLPATYANFLISNTKVFVPVYNQPRKDALAVMTLQSVFHDREIVPIDCTPLIVQHGSLHCVTMQIPLCPR